MSHLDKTGEDILIDKAETIAAGLNALSKEAWAMGIEIDVTDYGKGKGFELRLHRTVVNLDVQVGNPNYQRKGK